MGYSKFSSVSAMLVELGLPSFNNVLHNAAVSFNRRLGCSTNRLVIYTEWSKKSDNPVLILR